MEVSVEQSQRSLPPGQQTCVWRGNRLGHFQRFLELNENVNYDDQTNLMRESDERQRRDQDVSTQRSASFGGGTRWHWRNACCIDSLIDYCDTSILGRVRCNSSWCRCYYVYTVSSKQRAKSVFVISSTKLETWNAHRARATIESVVNDRNSIIYPTSTVASKFATFESSWLQSMWNTAKRCTKHASRIWTNWNGDWELAKLDHVVIADAIP